MSERRRTRRLWVAAPVVMLLLGSLASGWYLVTRARCMREIERIVVEDGFRMEDGIRDGPTFRYSKPHKMRAAPPYGPFRWEATWTPLPAYAEPEHQSGAAFEVVFRFTWNGKLGDCLTLPLESGRVN
jgi:hypothetical protein